MPCNHTRAGVVTSHSLPVPEGVSHATTPVCDRPECIAEALAWVARMTRQVAVHVPDEAS